MLKQNIHANAKCQTITNYPILYQITQYNFSITQWGTISDNERQVSLIKFSLVITHAPVHINDFRGVRARYVKRTG